MTESEKQLVRSNDLAVLTLKWQILRRIYDFRVMVCNTVSKHQGKKTETVAACKLARKELEKIEEKILKLK